MIATPTSNTAAHAYRSTAIRRTAVRVIGIPPPLLASHKRISTGSKRTSNHAPPVAATTST